MVMFVCMGVPPVLVTVWPRVRVRVVRVLIKLLILVSSLIQEELL